MGGGSTGTRPGVPIFESVKALLFFLIIIIFGRNETDHTKSEQHDKAAKTMFVSLKKKKQLLVVDFRTIQGSTSFPGHCDPAAGLAPWRSRGSVGGVHGPAA